MIDPALTERRPESGRLSNLTWPDNDLDIRLFFGQTVLNNFDKKPIFSTISRVYPTNDNF